MHSGGDRRDWGRRSSRGLGLGSSPLSQCPRCSNLFKDCGSRHFVCLCWSSSRFLTDLEEPFNPIGLGNSAFVSKVASPIGLTVAVKCSTCFYCLGVSTSRKMLHLADNVKCLIPLSVNFTWCDNCRLTANSRPNEGRLGPCVEMQQTDVIRDRIFLSMQTRGPGLNSPLGVCHHLD